MHLTRIVPEKCTGCEDCIFVCTIRAIKMVGGKAVVLDNCNDCKDCWSRCGDQAIFHGDEPAVSTGVGRAAAGGVEAPWRGVLVWLEGDGDKLGRASRELLAAGRQLADGLGVYLEAFLVGDAGVAQEAIARGADRVHRQEPGNVHQGYAARYEAAILELVRAQRYEIVLFPDALGSWELAPRVAQKLETVIFPPVTSLSVDFETRDLAATIPAYGGRLVSEVSAAGVRPQIALVLAGAFPESSADSSREGEVRELA